MKSFISRLLTLACAGALGAAVFGCDYARMNNDEAIDLYQVELPPTPSTAIPIGGGINALRLADIEALKNPLPPSPETVERGKIAYEIYCSHCHGPEAKGFGTVGQSFAPLPTDLHGRYVQSQNDGLLYTRLSLGYLRHPPMYSTVPEEDRWALVTFIRSLKSD